MKSRRFEDYGNTVQRLYCRDLPEMKSVCRNVTFQITNACNLQCSYCYEHHKSTEKMTLETGKKIVDYLLDLYEKMIPILSIRTQGRLSSTSSAVNPCWKRP